MVPIFLLGSEIWAFNEKEFLKMSPNCAKEIKKEQEKKQRNAKPSVSEQQSTSSLLPFRSVCSKPQKFLTEKLSYSGMKTSGLFSMDLNGPQKNDCLSCFIRVLGLEELAMSWHVLEKAE